MTSDRQREIKREIRDLAASGGPGAASAIQRLRGEYRREQRAADLAAITVKRVRRDLVPDPADSDPDAAAIATWPTELRVRLRSAALRMAIGVHDLPDPRR